MQFKLKYILSREMARRKAKRFLHKMRRDNVIEEILYSCKHLQYNNPDGYTTKQVMSTVPMQTKSCEELFDTLNSLLDTITSDVKKEKYVERLPEWVASSPSTIILDVYLIYRGHYLTPVQFIEEIEIIFTKINEQLGEAYNKDFDTYYITKLGRVYREVQKVLNSLNSPS